MENKNTTIIAAVIGVVIVALMFSFTRIIRTSDGSKALDDVLTVSMPRPVKDMILGFSLEGRSIIRQIEAFVTGIPAIAKKVDPKAAANGTKALADKGSNKTTTSAFAAARARAQLNEQRRQAFNARVVEQADRYRESLRLKAQAEAEAYAYAEADVIWRKQAEKAAQTNPKEQNEVEKLTAAEWKSLILAQPTEANVAKMIKAINTGGIEVDTYLEISEALVKDNSQEKRRMGVWALTSIYRYEAFVLAAHLSAAVDSDATTKKLLTDYMFNYNQPQKLGVFDQVLKSSDTVAATAAADSISKSIQNLQGQNQQGGRNNSRTGNGTVSQLTIGSYKRLLPTLQVVASKNLHNLSQWAQTLISQLQTISTTA